MEKLDLQKLFKQAFKFKDEKRLYKRKISVYVAIASMLLGGILYSFFVSNKPEQSVAVSVVTDKVKSGDISIKSSFMCKVRTPESVTLSSEVVGKIVFLKPDGVFVKKGELIVEIEDAEARGRYMIALGRKNEEDLKLATIHAMYKEGYKTINHVKEQEAKLQTAQGQLLEAQALLNKHKITAPFSGVIGLHSQSIGSTINQHSKLVTITNLGNLQVEFVIPESELRNLGGIEKIRTASIFVMFDSHLLPIKGKFSAYETVIDTETNAVAVRCSLEKTEAVIVPGQIGQVKVNVGTKENVLIIPDAAIETSHGNSYIYKVVDGCAVQNVVKTGIKDGDQVEVISGVQEDEEVIISGKYKLSDGQPVIAETNN